MAQTGKKEPNLRPHGYDGNGQIFVDAEKISKSKGNFVMMNETMEKYSGDDT
jgi:leucyl-tRNA synthetase